MTLARSNSLHALTLLLICGFLGACFFGSGDSSSVRSSVIAGLVASSGGGVTTHQAATFQSDIRRNWAIAYDPADPPGCTSGGLWGLQDTPAIPEEPCTAYVLIRRKSRWAVTAAGVPGSFVAPELAPKDLGDETRLVYLAP